MRKEGENAIPETEVIIQTVVSQYWAIAEQVQKMNETSQHVGTSPAVRRSIWIHFMNPVRGEISPRFYFELNESVPKEQFEVEVPDIQPVVSIKTWYISQPPAPEGGQVHKSDYTQMIIQNEHRFDRTI